jgi:hypothetical protein
MDPTYDTLNASMRVSVPSIVATHDYHTEIRLAELIKECVQSEHSGLQLAKIKEASISAVSTIIIFFHSSPPQDPLWLSIYQLTYAGEPKLWCLTRDDGSGGIEEIVAGIQGIICKEDMPPFTERVR